MEEYYDLFSTGKWYQDIVLYSIMGLLVLANIWLIKYRDIMQDTSRT